MTEFKKWISYLYAYNGEGKGKNVGFARVEARGGRCRLTIGVKGAYGCDGKGLEVGVYIREKEGLKRYPVKRMRIREGCGEFEELTPERDLFGTGISLEQCAGLWLISPEKETLYLSSWEKPGLDVREFLGGGSAGGGGFREDHFEERNCNGKDHESEVRKKEVQKASLESLPQLSLWDSLCRYYPKTAPELSRQGVELLQIRPSDIRYLPRTLWYYGNNSFLLHGYYHHKHLVLGRVSEGDCFSYLLGVPGHHSRREQYSANMFGFHDFLPLHGQGGYWVTEIRL